MRVPDCQFSPLFRVRFGVGNLCLSLALASSTIFVMACKNDIDKLADLEQEQARACRRADSAQEDLAAVRQRPEFGLYTEKMREWSATHTTAPANADSALAESNRLSEKLGLDTVLERWNRTRSECELARRRYQAFGR